MNSLFVPAEETLPRHDLDEAYHFVLLPGAWQPQEVYLPFMRQLEYLGHTAVLASIDHDDALQNVDDDTNAAMQAAGGHDNVVVLAHSRGAEVFPYLLQSLGAARAAAGFVISSGGPQSLVLKPEYPGQPVPPRYQPGFEKGIIDLGDGRTVYDPALALRFFYHDVIDRELVGQIVGKLMPEREAPSQTPPEMPDDIPLFSVRGAYDLVHNKEYGRQVDSQWLHTKAYEVPTGHSPQLSQPALLAREIIRLTRQRRN